MIDLNTIWFLLIAVLLVGYAILDGFDLGVGSLYLLAGDEHDRRIQLAAIGPVWDGNEVWLLTGGGALFAAFPTVYATVFSGFYLALMLLLVALIARAVAIEFRGKVDSPTWKSIWDWAFALGSALPCVLLGVAFGNIMRGIPIDRHGDFAGGFLGLLNPYCVLIGVLTLALFALHGSLYLAIKTDGTLHQSIARRINPLWIAVALLYCVATAASFVACPALFKGLVRQPLFWPLAFLAVAGLLYIPVGSFTGRTTAAFLASCAMIAGMIGLPALGLFPNLVPSSINPQFSLTIYNSSSSQYTLKVMLIIALLGMPLVIGYTAVIYRIFKGKALVTPEGY